MLAATSSKQTDGQLQLPPSHMAATTGMPAAPNGNGSTICCSLSCWNFLTVKPLPGGEQWGAATVCPGLPGATATAHAGWPHN